MKKSLIKMGVFVLVFIGTLFIAGAVMNKDQYNLTMEMAPASLPVIGFMQGEQEINQLHGYTEQMDCAFQRDTITVLGKDREARFYVDTFGEEVSDIYLELRTGDGSRLIESGEIKDWYIQRMRIIGDFKLKDLIEKDTEYALVLRLTLEGDRQVWYYTRCVWNQELKVQAKLDFVVDFHNRLYDMERARELTKYLETNGRLEDNSSFHKVNIHSSLKQITYGDLKVKEEWEPAVQITEMQSQTAAFVLKYLLSTEENREETYYLAEEYFRIRYTPSRIYLLDYERTMSQLPKEKHMCGNDKIVLGIGDKQVEMAENADGNVVAFQAGGKLLCYNASANKLAVLFSFYNEEQMDARTLWQQHDMKILDISEGGDVQFAVYGYMNRGRHEGKVGIQICHYDSLLNTVEEIVYIPYDKSYAVLQAEMDRLLYLSRDRRLYLTLENVVYNVNLTERNVTEVARITGDENMLVSDNHEIMVWLNSNDIREASEMFVRNMNSDTQVSIQVPEGECIRPLGFMGEDLIYGVARTEEVIEEHTGGFFVPFYKVCISTPQGNMLKEYAREGIYVTGCSVEDNQITLERYARGTDGRYKKTQADTITNNEEQESGRNTVSVAVIDKYKEYVQIKTRKSIDTKSLKVQTPKELVFEGGREPFFETEDLERYYVYSGGKVKQMSVAPARAVAYAYDISGTVVNEKGSIIWYRGNRVTRNQIMAIKSAKSDPERSPLAVCLDTILAFEGVVGNSAEQLATGRTAIEILDSSLNGCKVLDLSGSALDAVLYYVNRDIPVLALQENGDAVLITGFNEFNVVIMNPRTGQLSKKGLNDSAELFEENGNTFITYYRK
ncbi:MAG: hypothetical protein IKL04_01400 [Lachnospiraceae bacterium]|nr:hypothetical protein [Lachnospiraceae bacterium]